MIRNNNFPYFSSPGPRFLYQWLANCCCNMVNNLLFFFLFLFFLPLLAGARGGKTIFISTSSLSSSLTRSKLLFCILVFCTVKWLVREALRVSGKLYFPTQINFVQKCGWFYYLRVGDKFLNQLFHLVETSTAKKTFFR